MRKKSLFSPLFWIAPLAFSLLLQGCDLFGSAVSGLAEYCSRTTTRVTTNADLRRGTCAEDDCSLYEAIERANFCGGGDHLIRLPWNRGDYEISSPAETTPPFASKGANAFPAITDRDSSAGILLRITIEGASSSTNSVIRRIGDNPFRFFYVAEGNMLTLRHVTLENGHASGDTTDADSGGAIYNDGFVTLDHCLIWNNYAVNEGGGVYNNDAMNVWNGSEFRDNHANEVGGAILNSRDRASVTSVSGVYSGNSARTSGGAMYSYGGLLSLDRDTFIVNEAGVDGGAISNLGRMTVRWSTFTSNAAAGNGGALISADTSTRDVSINYSTFSANNAYGDGGAIYASNSRVDLTDCTVNRNISGGISGVYGSHSYVIRNTIIANSVGGPDCSESRLVNIVPGSSVNLDSDGSCGFSMTADPMLAALADNGGYTRTHLPLTGSPVIDTGSECSFTDQREMARPIGVACDIGAVEVGGLPPGAGGGGVGDTDDSKDDDQPGDPDTPPTVAITSHNGGEGYTADKFDKGTGQWYYELNLTGEGDDAEDGTLTGGSLVWTISPAVDGSTALGTGESVTAKLYGTTCEGDSYTITLTATDSDGNVVSTDIIIISYLFC